MLESQCPLSTGTGTASTGCAPSTALTSPRSSSSAQSAQSTNITPLKLFQGSLLNDLLQEPSSKDTMEATSHVLYLREPEGRAPRYELQGSTSWLTEPSPSASDTKSRTYKHRLALSMFWPALSTRPRPDTQVMSVSRPFADELCAENFSGRIYTSELDMSNGKADGVSTCTVHRLGDIKGSGKFKHPTPEDAQEAVFYTLTVDTVVRD